MANNSFSFSKVKAPDLSATVEAYRASSKSIGDANNAFQQTAQMFNDVNTKEITDTRSNNTNLVLADINAASEDELALIENEVRTGGFDSKYESGKFIDMEKINAAIEKRPAVLLQDRQRTETNLGLSQKDLVNNTIKGLTTANRKSELNSVFDSLPSELTAGNMQIITAAYNKALTRINQNEVNSLERQRIGLTLQTEQNKINAMSSYTQQAATILKSAKSEEEIQLALNNLGLDLAEQYGLGSAFFAPEESNMLNNYRENAGAYASVLQDKYLNNEEKDEMTAIMTVASTYSAENTVKQAGTAILDTTTTDENGSSFSAYLAPYESVEKQEEAWTAFLSEEKLGLSRKAIPPELITPRVLSSLRGSKDPKGQLQQLIAMNARYNQNKRIVSSLSQGVSQEVKKEINVAVMSNTDIVKDLVNLRKNKEKVLADGTELTDEKKKTLALLEDQILKKMDDHKAKTEEIERITKPEYAQNKLQQEFNKSPTGSGSILASIKNKRQANTVTSRESALDDIAMVYARDNFEYGSGSNPLYSVDEKGRWIPNKKLKGIPDNVRRYIVDLTRSQNKYLKDKRDTPDGGERTVGGDRYQRRQDRATQ